MAAPHEMGAEMELQHPAPAFAYPYNESGSDLSTRDAGDKEKALTSTTTLTPMTTLTPVQTSFEAKGEANGAVYGDNGQLVLLPAPTKDPRDPINLPHKRKVLGLLCLCLFGALSSAAELVLGSMLPVFALQYAGIDPSILQTITESGGLPEGGDPLAYLGSLPGAPPIWKTYLLGSMPILIMGISNLFLVPMAITLGRRPVILAAGVCAISGAIWAGFSQSLESHIAARCFQAIGAGTVESLIPFMIQDMVYAHQRNTAISMVFAAQGMIIIAIGIAAPYMIINLSWRYVYFITAAGASFFLLGTYAFMPETRWHRTRSEMNGIPRVEPADAHYEPRTWKYDLQLRTGPAEWRKGAVALLDTLTTFFYPHILFITMLNSVMISAAFAAAYTVSPALLTAPWSWSFENLGLCLVPVLISAIFVAGITGKGADWVANYFAKKYGKRLPEYQIINLILPTCCGILGTILFGIAGGNQSEYPWALFLFGLGLMTFGFLGANTIGAVYVLECYPQLAGPALVNIASFRCILAFIFSFRVSQWIADFGYVKSMMIYTGAMAAFALLLPVVYYWGPSWRRRWPGPDR